MAMQHESFVAGDKIPAGSVNLESHCFGLKHGEPITYGMDGMLRYARAYRACYEAPLSEDGVLGPHWLAVVKGLRGLLDGDGAVAMEHDRSTDSKDNGAVEEVFWCAMRAAGFGEGDL